MLVFCNKNSKELEEISGEVSGEVSVNQFFQMFDRAILEKYDFFFIDLPPKTGNSMFRQNLNKMIWPEK